MGIPYHDPCLSRSLRSTPFRLAACLSSSTATATVASTATSTTRTTSARPAYVEVRLRPAHGGAGGNGHGGGSGDHLFKMRRGMPLAFLQDAYCQRLAMQASDVELRFHGALVDGAATPDDLLMSDSDCLLLVEVMSSQGRME